MMWCKVRLHVTQCTMEDGLPDDVVQCKVTCYTMYHGRMGYLMMWCKVRPDFLDLLDYITCQSEKLGFQIKKKKKISRFSGEKLKLQATTMVSGTL